MLVDHDLWRKTALRVRARNEREARDSMRVMDTDELARRARHHWFLSSFPWCDTCRAPGVQYAGRCAWCADQEAS